MPHIIILSQKTPEIQLFLKNFFDFCPDVEHRRKYTAKDHCEGSKSGGQVCVKALTARGFKK